MSVFHLPRALVGRFFPSIVLGFFFFFLVSVFHLSLLLFFLTPSLSLSRLLHPASFLCSPLLSLSLFTLRRGLRARACRLIATACARAPSPSSSCGGDGPLPFFPPFLRHLSLSKVLVGVRALLSWQPISIHGFATLDVPFFSVPLVNPSVLFLGPGRAALAMGSACSIDLVPALLARVGA